MEKIPVRGADASDVGEWYSNRDGGNGDHEEEELFQSPDIDVDAFDLTEIAVDNSIGLYLKETAPRPLLSFEEEVELANVIEKGRAASERLQDSELEQEMQDQLEQDVERAKLARDRLILCNTRLVVSYAKKYRGRGVPFLDLIQEGNMGLMKAVEKYDPDRGYRFSTYATWWIRQCISRAVASQGRTIRIPVHMNDRIRRMYKTVRRLEQHNDRRPTPEEIAHEMGLKPHKVRWMLKVSRHPLSLELPVGEDKDIELGAFIEDDDSPTPPEQANESLLREEVDEALRTLTPREARILRLRFGLKDGHNYTLKEIGEKFDLTRERIRQIERKALRRLRHPRRSRRLKAFLT